MTSALPFLPSLFSKINRRREHHVECAARPQNYGLRFFTVMTMMMVIIIINSQMPQPHAIKTSLLSYTFKTTPQPHNTLPLLCLPPSFRLRLNLEKTTHLLHATRIHLLQLFDPSPLHLLLLLFLLFLAFLLLPLRHFVVVFFNRALPRDVV